MLHLESSADTATLVLDRPDKGNALSAELVEALIAEVDRACRDANLKTLVFRASGAHFCTGFDLSDLAQASEGDLLRRFVRVEELLQKIWTAPVRTVALAQGRTWGAGADLFAACEVRIAAADTTFRFPGARFGIALGTRRLAERVGADRARAWLTQGAEIRAEEGVAAGLATAVASNGALDEAFKALPKEVVDRETGTALRTLTRCDDNDRDLAELVRSAVRPGLKARIETYVAALRAGKPAR